MVGVIGVPVLRNIYSSNVITFNEDEINILKGPVLIAAVVANGDSFSSKISLKILLIVQLLIYAARNVSLSELGRT